MGVYGACHGHAAHRQYLSCKLSRGVLVGKCPSLAGWLFGIFRRVKRNKPCRLGLQAWHQCFHAEPARDAYTRSRAAAYFASRSRRAFHFVGNGVPSSRALVRTAPIVLLRTTEARAREVPEDISSASRVSSAAVQPRLFRVMLRLPRCRGLFFGWPGQTGPSARRPRHASVHS
jgi:hypothetical protein